MCACFDCVLDIVVFGDVVFRLPPFAVSHWHLCKLRKFNNPQENELCPSLPQGRRETEICSLLPHSTLWLVMGNCEHMCSFLCTFGIVPIVCDSFSVDCHVQDVDIFCMFIVLYTVSSFRSFSVSVSRSQHEEVRPGVTGTKYCTSYRPTTEKRASKVEGRIAECNQGHRLVHHHSVVTKHKLRQTEELDI